MVCGALLVVACRVLVVACAVLVVACAVLVVACAVLVVVIIAILVVAAAGYVYFEKLGPFKLASSTSVVVNDNSIATTSVATTTEDLWAVFDKETLALKNNDLAEFNKYSYKQVPAQAASQFSQFAPMMYQQNAKVNKNDYVNKWQDEKQAIYSTNPQKNNTTDSYGYNVGVVTFVKTNGSWEVLSSGVGYFGETAITAVGEPNRTQAQADKDLQAMMLDSDKDGLTDQEELCLGASQYDKTCVKTDPNNKDSNGNGWWDGIEAKMK